MSVEPIIEFYRDTEWGQGLQAIGRAEGLERGLEQGRWRVLLALLRARFGERPELPGLAERLASWGESEAVEAIGAAATVSELLTATATE
jgi:hypothetical protein